MKTAINTKATTAIKKKWNNDKYDNNNSLQNLKLVVPKKNGVCFFINKNKSIYFRISFLLTNSKNFSFLIDNSNTTQMRCIRPYNTKINLYFEITSDGIKNDRLVIDCVGNEHEYQYSKVNGLNEEESIYFGNYVQFENQVMNNNNMPEETKKFLYSIKEKINFTGDLSFVKKNIQNYGALKIMLKSINYSGPTNSKTKKVQTNRQVSYNKYYFQNKQNELLAVNAK